MAINYSLIAKKPLITWQELVELLFGCKDITGYAKDYDTPENNHTRKVQNEFKRWVLESLEIGELMGVDWDSFYGTEYLKFKKEVVFAWIQKNNVLDWSKENGVDVPNNAFKLINDSGKEELPLRSGPVDVSFPPHPLTDWGQINFCVLTEKACLEISVDGKVFSESELTDKKFTKHNLSLLYQIVQKRGFFDKSAFPDDKNLNQSMARLNKSLREIFKINQDSISYNKEAKGYKAAFQTEIDSTG